MIIETIVGPKDFNLLFSKGLCLVRAVALTDALQERSFGLYHVSCGLEEGRVLNVFLVVMLTQVSVHRTHYPRDGAGLVLAAVQLSHSSYVT